MTLKKVDAKHHGLCNMLIDYQLANELNIENFVTILEMAESIKNNLKNLVIASFNGDEKSYLQVKKSIRDVLESVFQEHDRITEEMHQKKIKDKH